MAYEIFKTAENSWRAVIEVSKNDRQGWGGAFSDVCRVIKKTSNIKRIDFDVKLTEEHDATNLRYFFPLKHFLNKNNIDAGIVWMKSTTPYFDKKNLPTQDDFGRAKQLFEGKEAANIFPIIQISSDQNSVGTSLRIEGEWNAIIILYLKDIVNPIIEFCNQYSNKRRTLDDVRYFIERCNSICEYLGEIGFDIKPVGELSSVDSVGEFDKKIASIKTDIGNLIISLSDDKNNLAEKNTLLQNISCAMGLFVLLNLFKSKLVPDFTPKNCTADISYRDKQRLRNTLIKVKSYSEGVYQLIENACVHSNGQTAFWGMRFYEAGVTKVPMNKLQENTQRRVRLWDRYIGVHNDYRNIFNNSQYDNFLELYVLDDAIKSDAFNTLVAQKQENLTDGIVDKIHDAQKEELDTEVYEISQIFNLKAADYKEKAREDYYIYHYGMRWLKHNVDVDKGIVQIASPCHTFEYIKYQDKEFTVASNERWFYSNKRPKTSKEQYDWARYASGALLKRDSANKFIDVNTGEILEPEQFLIELDKRKNSYQTLYSTEYAILLPLESEVSEPITRKKTDDLFLPLNSIQSFSKFDDITLDFVDTFNKKLNPNNKHQELKKEYIESIYKKILQGVTSKKGQKDYYGIIRCKFDCDVYGGDVIELLAKAIFKLIYNRKSCDIEKLCIALHFERRDRLSTDDIKKLDNHILEFIRIFTIFYLHLEGDAGKCGGGKDIGADAAIMSDVQIALCSTNAQGCDVVHFVLAGNNLRTAYNTAQNFTYFDAEASMDFLPALNYLTKANSKNSNADSKNSNTDTIAPLFPFDLMLHGCNTSTWFTALMMSRLNTDLRSRKNGCGIFDVNVRVGSKIMINNFYEAELLFHNAGNVKRFAYLIAKEIYSAYEQERELQKKILSKAGLLFLVGYENYSAVLIQEIEHLLRPVVSKGLKIIWDIDTHSNGKNPRMSFSHLTAEDKADISAKIVDGTFYFIPIIPVGSTMSTVYKLCDSFMRGLKANITRKKGTEALEDKKILDSALLDNYCIVAVGDSYKENINRSTDKKDLGTDKKDLCAVEKKYLLKLEEPAENSVWHQVDLQPIQRGEKGLNVKYLLAAESKWTDEIDTKDVVTDSEREKGMPVLHVDKTSTILNTVFTTPLPNDVLQYYGRSSTKAKLLKPEYKKGEVRKYVEYGHIVRGDNHYQYYFDFIELCRDQKGEIENWAKTLHEQIDADAYNIVISPLQITNASFLGCVIEGVFGSNLHLLHININEVSKENIRTKFNYISDELARICATNSKVNLYYVDDSVCTGSMILRAQKLLIMLCSQANVLDKLRSANDGVKFTKVFLMLNRSSYETARMFVNNPSADWNSFINLCVPSYNTHANHCPGCRVHDRYDLLMRRSSTESMAEYFYKKAKRHQPQRYQEYQSNQNHNLTNSPANFSWLRMWFYLQKEDSIIDKITIKSAKVKIQRYYEEISSKFDDTTSKAEKVKEAWNKTTLEDFLQWIEKDPNSKDEATNWRKYFLTRMKSLVAQEHYRRLISADMAYRELVYNAELQNEYQKALQQYENDVIRKPDKIDFTQYEKLLLTKMLEMLSGCFSAHINGKKERYECFMDFISYIKVFSREPLSQNYFIRKTAHKVLGYQCDIMSNACGKLDEIWKKYNLSDEIKKLLRNITGNIRNSDKGGSIIPAILQYRIFKVVVHELALMQSDDIWNKILCAKIILIYDALTNQDDALKNDQHYCLICLPPAEMLLKDYLATIKTAAMSEDDDKMCYKLFDFCNKKNERRAYLSFVFNKVLKLKNEDSFSKLENAITRTISDNKDIFDESKNAITRTMYLENTRMLFDFMQELCGNREICKCPAFANIQEPNAKYQGYIGEGGLGHRNELLTDLQEAINNALCSCIREDGELCYVNPLSAYVQFWCKVFGNDSDKQNNGKPWLQLYDTDSNIKLKEDVAVRIANMLNAFNILRCMVDENFNHLKTNDKNYLDSLPYLYEDLCLSFRTLMNAQSCYLVYQRQGEASQLISRSGYVLSDFDEDYLSVEGDEDKYSSLHIGSKQFDSIITAFWEKDKKSGFTVEELLPNIAEVKVELNTKTNNEKSGAHTFLVMRINAAAESFGQNDRKRYFYLIFEYNCAEKYSSNPWDRHKTNLLSIVFLRQRIQTALASDYTTLLNLRYRCDYIKSVRNIKTDISAPFNIMHMSDLHIQHREDGDILHELLEHGKRTESAVGVDLLAVTGDIVEHSNDAFSAQTKYKLAANTLFDVVKKLWGVETKQWNNGKTVLILPHDWRRRVLITSGNHDYAAMNDVRVQTASRKIETGIPASKAGGTMSRLTYYMEFLVKFLDAPISKLLSDDLNEIRHYRHLNLKVAIVNSVSIANSLQNNKVSVANDKIALLVKNRLWEEKDVRRLVLMHHSPLYRINYFDDKYNPWNWRYGGDDKHGERFRNEVYNHFIETLKEYVRNRGNYASFSIEDNLLYSVQHANNPREKFEDSELFGDMKLLETISNNKYYGQPMEFSENLLAKTRILVKTQRKDQQNLAKFSKLIAKGDASPTFLAGHVHENKYETISFEKLKYGYTTNLRNVVSGKPNQQGREDVQGVRGYRLEKISEREVCVPAQISKGDVVTYVLGKSLDQSDNRIYTRDKISYGVYKYTDTKEEYFWFVEKIAKRTPGMPAYTLLDEDLIRCPVKLNLFHDSDSIF